jgi:hypothetical protein
MAHDYHQALPGYSDDQILHDGCGECEARGKAVSRAITSLDKGRFALAWKRAADWNLTVGAVFVSKAERELLETLWAVQLRLEYYGVPIGTLPVATALFPNPSPEEESQ